MLDASLLPAFVAVLETGSFTRAAVRLGLSQSTVSQQVRRLERGLDCILFERDTHAVTPTRSGLVLLPQARSILSAIADAQQRLRGEDVPVEVRLGIPEDFAASRLPDILGRFRDAHQHVALRIEIDMSRTLLSRLRENALDLALVKSLREDRRPETILLSEPLVWVGAEPAPAMALERPLRLALHPEPSITRAIVERALGRARIPFSIEHVGNTRTGLRAGIAARLGISAFGRSFVPHGLHALDHAALALPALPPLDFSLVRRPGGIGAAAELLAGLIERSAAALHLPGRNRTHPGRGSGLRQP